MEYEAVILIVRLDKFILVINCFIDCYYSASMQILESESLRLYSLT